MYPLPLILGAGANLLDDAAEVLVKSLAGVGVGAKLIQIVSGVLLGINR